MARDAYQSFRRGRRHRRTDLRVRDHLLGGVFEENVPLAPTTKLASQLFKLAVHHHRRAPSVTSRARAHALNLTHIFQQGAHITDPCILDHHLSQHLARARYACVRQASRAHRSHQQDKTCTTSNPPSMVDHPLTCTSSHASAAICVVCRSLAGTASRLALLDWISLMAESVVDEWANAARPMPCAAPVLIAAAIPKALIVWGMI